MKDSSPKKHELIKQLNVLKQRMLRNWKHWKNIIFIVVILCTCIFLFTSFYNQAKQEVTNNINREQLLHASQAARGIEEFFNGWTRTLTALAESDAVINIDKAGKEDIALLHRANQEMIRAITRVDATGRIVYTFPFNRDAIGRNISSQPHIREIMRTHKPVVSDVIIAVQGYDTVALHVPVFRNKTYRGTIGIGINFQTLAKRYLEDIKIGDTGYAWMVSKDGTELYCPVPGHTGKSVFENCKDFPSILIMAKDMLNGQQGLTTYTFDNIRGDKVETVKKNAVYKPIHIENTFWSIVVASSEDEIISSLMSFRIKLVAVAAFLLFLCILFFYYGSKALLVVREEGKRRRIEDALRVSEARYSMLSQASFEGIIISEKGFVLDANTQLANMLGYDLSEIIGSDGFSIIPPDYRELFRQHILSGNELPYQIPIMRKDGTIIHCELRTKASNAGGRIVRVSAIHDITEYRLVEDELRKSEQQLRDTAENIPGVIYQFYAQPDGNIGLHYVSESAQKIFGLNSNSEGFFQRFSERVAPECLKSFTESITEAISAVKEWHYEGRFIKESGEAIWFLGLSKPVKSEREILFNGVMLNITEQKQAEEELLVSEEKYSKEQKFKQLLLDSSPAFIVAIGFDGKTMMMNQALLDTLEYTKEEITGADYLTTFVPEEDRITLGVVFQKIIQDGNVTVNENRILSRSGKEYLVEWHGRPSIHNGGLGFFVGIGIDITARKQAEEALVKSEEKLRLITENMLDGVALVDSNLTYQYVTPSYKEILGYDPEDMIGITGLSLTHPDDLERNTQIYLEAFEQGWREITLETRTRHKDGHYVPMELKVRLLNDSQGKVVGGVWAGRDITKRLQLEQERKRSEELLRESEARFLKIFDESPVITVINEIESGRYVAVNQAFVELIELPLESIIGKTAQELGVIVEEIQIDAMRDKLAARDEIDAVDVRIRYNDKVMDCNIVSRIISFNGVDHVMSLVIDVTARKQAEDKLALSEQQTRAILQASPIAIGRIRERRGEWANEMMSRITGYSLEEFQNQDSLLLYENDAEYERAGEILYAEGAVETRWVRKDGKIRDISIQITQTSSNAYIFTAMDITERKRADIELKLSQSYLKALVESFNEPIWSIDSELNFLTFNSNFANYVKSVLGFTTEIGKNTRSLYAPEVARLWESLYVRALGGEQFSIEYDYVIKEKRSYFELNFNPIITDDKITGVSVFARNITARKEAEEAQRILEERLQLGHKMESIGQLAGGIAHDFNNILGSISGFTQIALENVPSDSKASEYLNRIFKSSRRAVSLVNQILTFSRGTTNKLHPLRLSPIIKEALQLVSGSVPSTIDIRQNITAEPDMVMADETNIHQVVMNLCTNANFAMQKKGGVLSIGLVNESIVPGDINHPGVNPGSYLKLTVSDTGEGIEPANIAKIFDPFFTTRKQGEGTGLGLSVIHGIVKSLGGNITVESRLDQGTSFTILLPLLENFLPENIPEQEVAESIKGSGKILFVDDEEDLVVMATDMLESLGYEVTATQSSVEALEMFRANPERFDLVMTDQTMPKISGMAMAQEMMRIRPDTPIILCTGFSSTVNAEEVKIAGIRKFVLKPMIKNDIATSISQILNNTPSMPRGKFTGVRALVADDQDFNREIMVELLLQVGIEADVAINGRDAMEMVRRRDYDILLIDIEMPEMDGLAAAREIRNLEGKGIEILPILALSGHAALSDREESIAAGMNDHLTKPIDTVVLYRALRQWLPQEKYAVVAEEEPDILPIPLVPGLNVEAALKRLRGNRQLYRKLLDSYIPGYGDTSAKLLQEVQAGNWEDALRRVHSIKGVAGTLGSTALAAAAGKLEKVLRVAGSCDSPKLKKPLQGFFDRQEELVANIAAVLPRQLADAPAMPEGPPWDAAEMRLLLTRLKSALRSEEPLLCNKIMEELLQRPCPNDLHGVLAELGRLISRYRLAEALVLLENEFKDILV